MSGLTRDGLASIIIPCFNQREFTRTCVAALMKYTRQPWELIAIDNGSSDGTAAYFEGVSDATNHRVEIISNRENLGFPAACNQGLRAARGEYVVLLNNDAVVTNAWLDQLIALAKSDPKIGLVGPMSNCATPPQLVEDVPYRDLDGMHRFATKYRVLHRGTWFTTQKLSGFCLLIKRGVFDAIGELDEQFGLGMFDDDDLCLRARRAGFDLAVAHDLFVHHFGSRTFAGEGIDAESLLRENGKRFRAKWGENTPVGRSFTLHAWDTNAPRAVRRFKVSLTMIVRNEEHNLPACLESARGLFDEIVVADTGSEDRTRAIALEYGAKLVEFPWIDDFAAARNAALAGATGDYAFWLDADDRIEPGEYTKLKVLLDNLDDASTAYVVRCACDPDPSGGGATVVDHVRLFPVRPEVAWEYRVHEQILPSLRRAGVEIRWTACNVRHTGYNDPVLRRHKLERDLSILRREQVERPNDPFVLFNIGQIALDQGDVPGALGHLGRSLAASSPTDSITRKVHALIALCHQRSGDLATALATCEIGLADFQDDAELLFRKAVVHRLRHETAEAVACWRYVLTLKPPEHFSSVDSGIYGHLTRRNLATLAEEGGNRDEAKRLWSEVLAELPQDATAEDALARLCGRIPGGELRTQIIDV